MYVCTDTDRVRADPGITRLAVCPLSIKCWVRVFSKSRMYGVMLHSGSIRSCHVSLSSGRYASENGVSAPALDTTRMVVCALSIKFTHLPRITGFACQVALCDPQWYGEKSGVVD